MSVPVRINKLFKPPRALRLLAQFGEDALKSRTVKGQYFGPMIPKRIAASVRKRALKEGTYGSFDPILGGWDPAWDVDRKIHMLNPYKGHLYQRNREARAKKIDDAMKAMPEKIKKLRQEAQDRRPKKDVFYMFKKVLDRQKSRDPNE